MLSVFMNFILQQKWDINKILHTIEHVNHE